MVVCVLHLHILKIPLDHVIIFVFKKPILKRRTSLSHPFIAGLLSMDFLSFPSLENVFISLLFLKAIFAGYIIWG